MFAAWKGLNGDERIWYASYSGTWSDQQEVPGAGTSYGPSLAIGKFLILAWKGVEGDGRIWWLQGYHSEPPP